MDGKLQWDQTLEVGIEIIDTQHKVLIDLINDLITAVNTNAEVRVNDTLFEVIRNYTFKHFATEEDLLTGRSDFYEHCYHHYQLLKQLNDYMVDFRNRRHEKIDPGGFFKQWLSNHIQDHDIPSLSHLRDVHQQEHENIDTIEEFEVVNEEQLKEQRRHGRIRYECIVEEQIAGQCYNANTLKGCPILIIDLSVGGLKIYSEERFDIDDLLIVSCKLGSLFNMKERVVVRFCKDNFYGVEFVSLKQETKSFLTQIYGSVLQSRL